MDPPSSNLCVQQSTVYTIAPFAFYPNDTAILCMYMKLNKNKDDFKNADNFAYGFGMHNRVFIIVMLFEIIKITSL